VSGKQAWGKNQFFRNHSKLFLKDDIKPEIYYYADNVQVRLPAYSDGSSIRRVS
jgi:hypothetical protein